jgi:hypothetical protein
VLPLKVSAIRLKERLDIINQSLDLIYRSLYVEGLTYNTTWPSFSLEKRLKARERKIRQSQGLPDFFLLT